MPRYFFHVQDGKILPDTEGTELPDLTAARDEATAASGEILKGFEGSAAFWVGDDWTMTVTDEVGKALLTLRFSGVQHA